MTKIIGIDVYSALHSPRGMGNYTINILKELAKLDQKNKYILYADIGDVQKILPQQENFVFKILHAKGQFHYEQFILPKQCKLDKIDLLFSPANTSPVLLEKNIKRVLALHDIIYLKKEISWSKNKKQILGRIYYALTSFNAKKAVSILTPTEYSKNDIINMLHISPNKIFVDSRGHEHFNIEKATDLKLLQKKYKIPTEYFFHVGGDSPNKNTELLVNLFSEHQNLHIVIAGIKNLENSYIYNKYKLFNNIVFVPYITQEDLVGLYKNAMAFIFPSIYEGFGLPLLEAMKCNCPIICSNASCLPEVAGDAVLYFSPENKDDLLEKINLINTNKNLQASLKQKGQQQLQKYSWKHSAMIILNQFFI